MAKRLVAETTLGVRIPKALHQRLRVHAVERLTMVRTLVIEAVTDALRRAQAKKGSD